MSPSDGPPTSVIGTRRGKVYFNTLRRLRTLLRSGYAPINLHEMYYEIHGAITGRPLVTIHGRLRSAAVFPAVTQDRQLIAVELDRHALDCPMQLDQHAADVAALLRYLRIPTPISSAKASGEQSRCY